MNQLNEAAEKLRLRIEKEDYRGFDPYDALNSRLFELPFLKRNKPIRFLAQQIVKRFPLNLRPILAVPKGENPVTLGLAIQSYAYLLGAGKMDEASAHDRINNLIVRLKARIPEGFHGACWGYDFDWEARYAKIPAYQPTVVATGIITNGLYEAFQITGIDALAELIKSAADFVVKDLNRSENDKGHPIFSYSPFDHQRVYNASLKGVRLLVQSYILTGNEAHLELARSAANYVLANQNQDGSWYYSEANGGDWIDNYHTGYVLDCLRSLEQVDPTPALSLQISKGLDFYCKTFVGPDGEAYFYSHEPWPIDCTGGGQQILTLTRFDRLGEARRSALFMVKTMQKGSGGFAFRKFKSYIIRTEFMRWSNAWMFAALSYFQFKEAKLV